MSSGNYSVIVTDVNGCEAEVANVNIGADSGPVAAFESSTNEVDVGLKDRPSHSLWSRI